MTRPKIGIILSTTREGRFADRASAWITALAGDRDDADYEIVDLRDFPIPYFDAPMSPRHTPVSDPVAQRFSSRMAALDGYIFMTAEYNHTIPAVLKNAIDHLYLEGQRKPAAFVGYGAVGAARAVEHLRQIVVEQEMVPMKSAVHVNMEPFLGLLTEGKEFADYPYLAASVTLMLDEMLWYAQVLKAGRDGAVALAA